MSGRVDECCSTRCHSKGGLQSKLPGIVWTSPLFVCLDYLAAREVYDLIFRPRSLLVRALLAVLFRCCALRKSVGTLPKLHVAVGLRLLTNVGTHHLTLSLVSLRSLWLLHPDILAKASNTLALLSENVKGAGPHVLATKTRLIHQFVRLIIQWQLQYLWVERLPSMGDRKWCWNLRVGDHAAHYGHVVCVSPCTSSLSTPRLVLWCRARRGLQPWDSVAYVYVLWRHKMTPLSFTDFTVGIV